MYKFMAALKRKEGVSREEFHHWWLERHVPFVKKLPRVRRYAVNLVVVDNPRSGGWDGVAEVWFDSLEDLQAAFGSPEAQAAQAHSTAHASDVLRLVVEEHVQIE
ncbi:MAG: EthD family reductase [Chloroflexi bacterium]|nr:EthD family reductase [Chloroflexota bacterium]